MKHINYDFSRLEMAISNIKTNPSPMELKQLNYEINKFFKDSVCKDVIYTKNDDKLFFGMAVIPVINSEEVTTILLTNEKVRITKYYVELDSKLFEMNLSNRELTAILLHEIGHMVNDATPIDELRKNIDVYQSQVEDVLNIEKLRQFSDFVLYGIKDAVRKITTVFNKKDEEVLADEFVVMCGYGKELESALKTVTSATPRLNADVSNKFIVLLWSLKFIKEMKFRRIRAIESLNSVKKFTGSVLEKREIDSCLKFIQRVRIDSVREAGMFHNMKNKLSEMHHNMKVKGMRQLEDDIYEYALRVKNVDEQEEALAIMRELNSKMSIIEDYVTHEKMSETEKKRWFALLDRYLKVRDQLSSKTTYDDKYYGLFVKTPVIKSRYEV